MAQVIIVSNRLPISVKKDKGKLVFSESLGGLATGLSSYVSDNRGSLWIGWPGIPSDELSKEDKIVISDYLSKESYVPVFLNQKQIDNFYNGYSNSILWPLFHGLRYKNYDPKKLKIWWQAYQSINRRYSDAVSSVAKDKSRIWVHDYQLLLVPEILRKEKPSLNVGFFLHIPFPTPKQYLKLHEGKKLILGILGADLIGFHTASYVENFIDATKEFSLGEQLGDQINIDDRFVRIAQFPMGIDYEKFVEARKLQDVKEAVKRYEKKYRRLRVIASVDRLDPSKGLVERLNAYSKFLEINPRMRGKVVFTMIAAPSRTSIKEYQSLSRRLKKLAQEINDTYAYKKWLPVDYINEAMPFEEVNALFQIADVAFITPLRDGMNLTAKEFVASNKRNGVLILSETAGAADELEDAIKVDPKDQGDLVRALGIALRMRKREHRQRLKRMRRSISANTVQSWSQTFLETLQQPLPSPRRLTKGLSKNHLKKLMDQYKSASKRLLLLDYDGTLVPFKEEYNDAKPSDSLLSLLNDLASKDGVDIVVISGRSSTQLDSWFGHLPVNLVAEHGAIIKKAGKTWKTIEKIDSSWKQLLLPVLNKYASLAPGAKVEIKPHSLVWHYRSATPYYAHKYSIIIKRALKPIVTKSGLEIMQGNKVLEIKNPNINKGFAAIEWLTRPYDFILAIGDDVTDEELFTRLPMSAYSIKVGRGLTKAIYRVGSYKDVLALLKKMA